MPLEKIIFVKMTATLTSPFMSVICLSVCIGFPYHIQPEVKMHFNILLFSIHKAVITLQVRVVGGGGGGGVGDIISTAY